jgi:PAS domain S-box-containing protein
MPTGEGMTAGPGRVTTLAALPSEVLAHVMDSMSEGVTVVDEHGRVVWQNAAARRLLGTDDGPAGPRDRQAHLGVFRPDGHTPFPPEEMPLKRALAGDSCTDVEMCLRTADQPDGVWITVSAQPLDPVGPARAVAVYHDITASRRTEDALRQSGQRMRTLLDGATDYAIFMLDRDGLVQSWSASATRMTGFTDTDVLGRHFGTFFLAEDAATGQPDAILAEATTSGRVETEGIRVRYDGTTFWAHGIVTALRDGEGRLTGFVKVARDITARRRAEAKFQGMMEAAPDAMVGVDDRGLITVVNSHTEELFGYQRGELLGRGIEVLVPADVAEVHTRHRARYRVNPTRRRMGHGMNLHGRRSDGTLFPAEVSLSMVETEDGSIVIAAVRDVTDRQQAERAIMQLNQELQTLNLELESRVEERTAQLRAQTDKLRQANAELESFSYSVSHDLRAPLRAVSGFARILTNRYSDALDETGRRYLTKVDDAAIRMGELIDGLLNFSRLQRLSLSSRPVDLQRLVRDVWEELAPHRADRDVRLALGALPPAAGDANLLRHVVTNLLDNAIKYTRNRRVARVEVGHGRTQAGLATYYVRDNGAGFDMQYIDKLFQVFQRLHRAEDYAGTGIGLALAHRIIQRHGGNIWAEAAPNRGATFYFTLPITSP